MTLIRSVIGADSWLGRSRAVNLIKTNIRLSSPPSMRSILSIICLSLFQAQSVLADWSCDLVSCHDVTHLIIPRHGGKTFWWPASSENPTYWKPYRAHLPSVVIRIKALPGININELKGSYYNYCFNQGPLPVLQFTEDFTLVLTTLIIIDHRVVLVTWFRIII